MSRKPDYNVHAMNKVTNAKARIGAAWMNEDHTISIVLDAFVVVPGGSDLLITLFPNVDKDRNNT
jgi:hypothetical protein